MVEKIILDYLNAKADVPVYMERPETAPSKYILLEKTGSSRTNYIMSSMFAVQSYAPTLYEAAELNKNVKEWLYAILELPEISSVSLNSDYNFTNTADKQYRYQAVFEFTHY